MTLTSVINPTGAKASARSDDATTTTKATTSGASTASQGTPAGESAAARTTATEGVPFAATPTATATAPAPHAQNHALATAAPTGSTSGADDDRDGRHPYLAPPSTSASSAAGGDDKTSDGHAPATDPADALLSLRLGAPVRPLARGRTEAAATALWTSAGSTATERTTSAGSTPALPRATPADITAEATMAAETADPATKPGPHRADLTVGEGDKRIVVSVMANDHQVRVHARAASGDETAALRAGADELRGALRRQGLELTYLGAETTGGQSPSGRGADREPDRGRPQPSETGKKTSSQDEGTEAARPDVRVLA